jgi:hypothetical protein
LIRLDILTIQERFASYLQYPEAILFLEIEDSLTAHPPQASRV